MAPIVFGILFTFLLVSGFYLLKRRYIKMNYLTRMKKSLMILDKLYENVNGMEISLTERNRLKTDDPSLTYGEIGFPSIASSLAIAEPKAGEVFYDLGAGAGKAVFSAALLNDWKKCSGVELLPALHECTKTLLEKLRQMPEATQCFPQMLENIHFIQSDIMNVDFSDADIVYMNATAFGPEMLDPLIAKFEALKPGARIILLTKKFNQDKFELLHATFMPVSWGMSSVRVYRRI